MTTRLAVLALVLAGALTGCADELASIEILEICAPPDAGSCGTSGSCAELNASPRLWVFTSVGGATNSLGQFIQINNQLPANGDPDLYRVNTNDFIGGEYLLEFRSAIPLPPVTFPANFTIEASSSSTPVVPLIPPSTMAALSSAMADGSEALVVVELRVRGELRDGTEIESGPFEVAVDVIDANFPIPTCPTPGDVVYACPALGQTSDVACGAP